MGDEREGKAKRLSKKTRQPPPGITPGTDKL